MSPGIPCGTSITRLPSLSAGHRASSAPAFQGTAITVCLARDPIRHARCAGLVATAIAVIAVNLAITVVIYAVVANLCDWHAITTVQRAIGTILIRLT